MELWSSWERNYRKSSNNPWRLNYIVFLKLKFWPINQIVSNLSHLEFPIPSKLLCIIHPISVELAEYARTQSISVSLALDCENSKESPCEQGEYVDDIEYEPPDLCGGIEGTDYGIVYGIGDEEMEMKAEA